MFQKPNITFVPLNDFVGKVLPPPKPARKYYPDFMKEMPSEITSLDGNKMKTASRCAPFTDAFMSGYIQELPFDVEIKYNGKERNKDIISYSWADNTFRPMNTRYEEEASPNLFPHFENYYNAEFHWISPWEPITPKGWSVMYHHPSNRPDLPFYTMTGIIDTDMWTVHGPVPFFIKEGFEGIIPAGTPIYQMTLIKRQGWVSESKDYDYGEQESMRYRVRKKFGGYRQSVWQRKSFL